MADSALLIIPAFNEAASLGPLLDEVKEVGLEVDVLVVSDGSSDNTAEVVRQHDTAVLELPFNLGVGGAVQAGFKYAREKGYDYALRIDSDGQHPPAAVAGLLEVLKTKPDVDAVVASRFLVEDGYTSTPVRMFGTRVLRSLISKALGQEITDPTSGFMGINAKVLELFSEYYPRAYPEVEALGMLRRYGYTFTEHPAAFRARIAGESSLHGWVSWKFVYKVAKELLIFKWRPLDERFRK